MKRLPTDTTADMLAVPIAVAIMAMDMAMATTAHITAMATDGPIMVMDMGVAGVTERGRNTNLNSRVQSKPVATSARSFSATGSARWLRGTRLASDCAGRISLCPDLAQ